MNPEFILLNATSAAVLGRVDMPPCAEQLAPLPESYATGPVAHWLADMTGKAGSLWSHQVEALQELAQGKNIVVATGTASGKSLIAMAPVIKQLILHPTSTYLVLIPQKALLGDQLARWKIAVERAGLDPEFVAAISGDIETGKRTEALKNARILLATDDIFHAWVMRNYSAPLIQAFVGELCLVVIDEAHERKDVFGSNCAFFYRRIEALQARYRATAGKPKLAIQWLALSATIADPAGHLRALTGREFEVVDESCNGAPNHGLTIFHIEGPDHGAAGEAMLVEIIGTVAREIAPNAAIAFVDGRQPVERITSQIAMDEVEPYRSGFEAHDRASIEQALRAGTLRAVVATSALELGVDIPQFTIGFNLGVPQTKMATRQRMGRAGRSTKAVFAIVAPANAFAKLGTTFEEFLSGEVEPSPLYIGNSIIQFGQAQCLRAELGGDHQQCVLPSDVCWPTGFANAFALALPGARRPREIEQVATMASGIPHLDFPMRRIGEGKLSLRHARSGEEIGTIDLPTGLREAYPGAAYLQRKQSYRVTEWRQTVYEQSIYLEPTPIRVRTFPILTTQVCVSQASGELLEGHLLLGDRGSIAEIRLQVTETVRGYKLGKQQNLYRDLEKSDRRKRPKQRNYTTTGVLIRIDEPWFKGHGGSAAENRKQVAKALVATLACERGIAPGELAYAFANIAMHDPAGPRQIDDAIVIFDDVLGGMRLTEPLFSELEVLLGRLRRASDLAGKEALLDEITVVRLIRWLKSLRPKDKSVDVIPAIEGGQRLIFADGSIVGVRVHGSLEERCLLGPELLTLGGSQQLFYRYESEGSRVAYVPHDQVEPMGHAWRQVLWDPDTNTIEEIAA